MKSVNFKNKNLSNLMNKNKKLIEYIQTLFPFPIKSIEILYSDTTENLSDKNFYE